MNGQSTTSQASGRALLNSRINTLVFGAADPKGGATSTLYNVSCDPRLSHNFTVIHGVLADESAQLLQDFFEKFNDVAPLHSYCDLLSLARSMIDTKNPDSDRLYCITCNLGNIAKYWFEGTDSRFNVPRQYHLKATTGRKSELDVIYLYNLYYGVKKYLL
jgi:hypothetical protein